MDMMYKEEFGKPLLNYWLTALEFIAIFNVYLCFNGGENDDYDFAIGLCVIVCVVVFMLTKKKANQLNQTGFMKFVIIAAQLLSPLSIIFILLMISMIKQELSKKNKKKEGGMIICHQDVKTGI
jgi:D-alanyl-lipoteichoic acid acyltransferase DltB (MBOAT superfamily)